METDMVISVPAGVTIDAMDVLGDITIDNAAAAVLTVKTVNGGIHATTAIGPMTAETVNGTIDARVDSLPPGAGALMFKTINGNVTATLPASLNGNADLETANGEIITDFPLTTEGQYGPKHARGTIGSGGASVTLHTINGSVTLHKR